MPVLSIIVPIYNAEKYLEGCVRSIISQYYKDFELILIDDGSTDMSGGICDNLSASNEQIIVIHQKNSGVSSARNAGIDKAMGKYLAFVDVDDYVDLDMYNTMIATAEQSGAEYLICGYHEVFRTNKRKVLFNLPEMELLDREFIVNKLLFSIYTKECIINASWNKLYKKDIIDLYHIRFPKRRRAEDWLFNIRYLEVIRSAMYVNKPLYYYVRNDHSVMAQVLPEQYNLWKENAQVRREIAERYHLNVDWKEVNKYFLEGVIPWAIAMFKQEKTFRFNSIYNDREFIDACKNSYRLDEMRLEFVRKMINASLRGLARLLCMI